MFQASLGSFEGGREKPTGVSDPDSTLVDEWWTKPVDSHIISPRDIRIVIFNVAHRNEVPDTEQRGGRKGAGNLRRLLRSIGRIPTFPPLGFDIEQYIPPTTFTFNRIGFLSCPHLKRIDIGYPLSKSGTLVEGAIVSFGTFSSLF